MKKFAPIAIIALFGAMSLVSCKKDYTCTCKDAAGNVNSTTTITYKKVKKSDAKTACDLLNSAAALNGGSCSL